MPVMSEGNQRETGSNGPASGTDGNKYLKVAPNLFTPERLHLFDSLDLYVSLTKCGKAIEQGERLHNLSWRIMNKALLKDKDINKSKKREGVKNLYYVLNPITNKQPMNQQLVKTPSQSSTTSLRSPPAVKRHAVPRMEPLSKASTAGSSQKAANNSNGSLFTGAKQHKSTSALSHIHRQRIKKEDPQTIVKGFEPNTVITPSKSGSSAIARKTKNRLEEGDKNTFYIESTPSPEPDKHNGSTTTIRKPLPSRQESLFGKPTTNEDTAMSSSHNSMFFSSEEDEDDDDSDWDDDSPLYDEDEEVNDDDEEDQYYRRQWDKLLFAKNAAAHSSGNVTPTSASSHDPIKRSLLSGLFLNEQAAAGSAKSKASSSVASPSSNHQAINTKHLLGTSNVTAVGSVTPPHKIDTVPIAESKSTSSAASKQSPGQSNAPPAAQTILPTALSTHMFLPNNVHQQRLAMAAAAGSQDSRLSPALELQRRATRRESMDIPSKNRNNTFIKTRMEISEEEMMSRAYTRRNP